MSMPTMLRSKDILENVKEKLLQTQSNIEILEQCQFTSNKSALPSLKTESFILYKNLQDNSLNIAKTLGLEIKQILNIEEFKDISSQVRSYEPKKLADMINRVNTPNTSKLKL